MYGYILHFIVKNEATYFFLQSNVSKKLNAANPVKSKACLAPALPWPASKCLYAATPNTAIVSNEPRRDNLLLAKLNTKNTALNASTAPANGTS